MRKVELHAVKCSAFDVARRVWEALDTPVSLSCYMLLQAGEYDQLVSKSVDPFSYNSSSSFADDVMAVKYLSKFPNFKLSSDPEQVAKDKFWEAEELCRQTNHRFRAYRERPLMASPEIHRILHSAARRIASLLGRLNLEDILNSAGWGPGVSSSSKGPYTSVYNKFQDDPGATPHLIAAGGHQIINAYRPWSSVLLGASDDDGFSLPASILSSALPSVPGNAVAFVPKNAKTHRAIAVEPHLNSFIQKGVGKVIRRKLKRVGVNLDDQTPNQWAAKEGSLTGSLASVDLSSASDTISLELVRELLPEPWFDFMDMCRSKDGFLDGSWFRYHKFSSMGNGFTFELESLIFWAITAAVVEDQGESPEWVFVYGDDILMPSSCFDALSRILDFCGFIANPSKSFHTGPFRESCGKDYFGGRLVRPLFLKEEITDAREIYRVANSLRRYGCLRNAGLGCDSRFQPVWNYLVHRVPQRNRYAIPDGCGDGGFVSNFDEAVPSHSGPTPFSQRRSTSQRGNGSFDRSVRRLEFGLEGYSYKYLAARPVKREFRRILPGVVAMLWSTSPDSSTSGFFSLRGKVRSEVRTATVRLWPNLGPWL